MWKWLCSFAVIASAVVAVTYVQHHARDTYRSQSRADCLAIAVSIEDRHTCFKEALSPNDYAPWWSVLVTWPEGITTWAIIATGFIIAWQSSETSKSARAARDSIRLQELALVQWVDLVNWKSEYVRARTGGPGSLKVSVDVVNPTELPLTIHNGHIIFGGNSTFFLGDEFILTPKVPYTADLSRSLTEKEEFALAQGAGLWFSVRGELTHVGTLRKFQPQPVCGHLTLVNGQPPMWHPEMPAKAGSKG